MDRFNVYYEMPDEVAKNATVFGISGKYFVIHGKNAGDRLTSTHHTLYTTADRVWQEWNDGEIKMIKSRYTNIFNPPNESEFMWVKLSSKSINA